MDSRIIGFSTGAIAKSDFLNAITSLISLDVAAIELSALRLEELLPLTKSFTSLNLHSFKHVSIHAPSKFLRKEEWKVTSRLATLSRFFAIPVIVHPDMIFTPKVWAQFEDRLYIENMDKRKTVGRTSRELDAIFKELPKAKLCMDLGHAHQIDPSMNEAAHILMSHGYRLGQVHLSEVDENSKHVPLSVSVAKKFREVAGLISSFTPIILEAELAGGETSILEEIATARQALIAA